MKVSINKEGGRTFAAVEGRIDTTNAEEFQKEISVITEDAQPDIEIDCSALEYTSSQGLRMFLMLQKTVSSKGGKMVMKNMKPQVKEVFDITGFSSIIRIV